MPKPFDPVDPDLEEEEVDSFDMDEEYEFLESDLRDEDDEPVDDEPPVDDPADKSGLVNRIKSEMGGVIANQQRALESIGLAMVNGQLAVTDRARYTAFQTQQGMATAPAATQTQQQEQDPQPEEEPDPTLDPEGWAAWQKKEMDRREKLLARRFEAQTAAVTAPLQNMQATAALNVAESVLPDLGIGHILEDERFEAMFKTAVRESGVPMENWTNPKFVKTIASMLLPELAENPAPRSRRPTADEAAQRRREHTQRTVGASTVARGAHSSTGPSRASGRSAGNGPSYTPAERAIARLSGMSLAEVRASADPTGRALGKLFLEQKKRASK